MSKHELKLEILLQKKPLASNEWNLAMFLAENHAHDPWELPCIQSLASLLIWINPWSHDSPLKWKACKIANGHSTNSLHEDPVKQLLMSPSCHGTWRLFLLGNLSLISTSVRFQQKNLSCGAALQWLMCLKWPKYYCLSVVWSCCAGFRFTQVPKLVTAGMKQNYTLSP